MYAEADSDAVEGESRDAEGGRVSAMVEDLGVVGGWLDAGGEEGVEKGVTQTERGGEKGDVGENVGV